MIVAAALVATAAAYLAAALRAPRWPRGRTAAFVAGLALLAGALQVDDGRLSAHMVQHLLLTLAVPPLLVLGRPFALMLRGGPASARRPLADVLRSRPAAILGHPVTALALFAGALVGTHVPAFYDAALRHAALHDAEHLLYLAAALLFWQVVLAPEPHPRAASPLTRMLLVLGAMIPMAIVGVALLVADSVVYPTYGTALADQRTAAAIMWVWGTLVLAVAVIAAGWWGVRREHRRQLAREVPR